MATLRKKVHLVNTHSVNTIFKLLGIDFGDAESVTTLSIQLVFMWLTHSPIVRNATIVNLVAYRTIALDFSFWSLLPASLSRLHLAHFQTVLEFSRFKSFNGKSRLDKLGVVKRMLFVLQTPMYKEELVEEYVNVLLCVLKHNFSPDAAIKPLISYLAASLEQSGKSASSNPGMYTR